MKPLRTGLFLVLLGVGLSCQKKAVDPDPAAANADWSEASHGNDVTPDYTTVFPQDQVNSLDITMTAADWTAIRADMKTKFGNDFGAGGTGTPGGGGVPGQFGTAEPNYVALTLKFNGKTWNKVGFRLKGNSSLNSAWRSGVYKLPFRLNFDEFEDQFPEIKNQRFYGFEELSLSPGFADNSLIREKVTADIFRMAGIPAAQTAFYKVTIDFGEGPKYCGVYTMVEVVDDTMVENQFGEDKGNIYKPESNFVTFNQAQFEKKNNKTEADYSDVRAFITALNAADRATNPAQWRANLEKTFHMDHYLKWLAANNTLVNWDTYGAIAHNYYLYNAPGKGLTWIPWDHNQSMSGSGGGGGGNGGGGGVGRAVSLAMTEVGTNWPLLRYVATDPVYYARYKQYVKTFTETVFTTEKMAALFEKNTNLIAPHVVGPQATETGKYSFLSNPAAFTAALPALKTHVSQRAQVVTDFLK